MNEEKINILPVIGNGGGSGTDTANIAVSATQTTGATGQ